MESASFQEYLAGGPMPLLVPRPGDFDKLMAACMAKPPFFPYSLKQVMARRATADYPLHCAIMKQMVDSPQLRGPIGAPALIVWGTEDRILSPKGAPATRALMPNARLIMMDGIGHLPMLEATRRTARDFLDFQGKGTA
jgi:pimeloyl-ACP methyl ester carboxylesterase